MMDDDAPMLLHKGPLPPFSKEPRPPLIENPNPPWRICPECGLGPGAPPPPIGTAMTNGGVHLRDCSRGRR